MDAATRLDFDPADLTIAIAPATSPVDAELDAAIDARWSSLCAQNPKLFDAPILAFERFDATTSTVHARLESYRRLAVQSAESDPVRTGVTILSVTGVLTDDDAVLVGRRSAATRVYPGLWELAPSGGIDPPSIVTENPSTHHTFDGGLALAALAEEAAEELSLELDTTRARLVGLVPDPPPGHSVDLLLRVPIQPSRIKILNAWEYDDVAWVRLSDLEAFVREEPCIPPLVGVVRAGLLVSR